jgi:hypothetical protein
MSGLRASADHATVMRAQLQRARDGLMRVWQDQHAQDVDGDVFGPLDQEIARIVETVNRADNEVDAALRALRGLGAHI